MPTEVSGKPEQRNVANSFDFLASLVSLPRLRGESNVEYKQRILDVSVHPGGPLYLGCINNLTRDLGLPREQAIQIDLKRNSAGEPIASNPRADILSNRVVLYKDWRPDEDETAIIDKEIRIYSPDDPGYFLEGLVAEINTSECFSAILYDVRGNLHSTNLIRKTSDFVIFHDPIKADIQNDLTGDIIIQDSLYFDETEIFETEVSGTPAAEGEYQIDYLTGKVYSFSNPSGNYTVTYNTALFPMEVDYSLVKIYTLQDDDFADELFDKKTADSGEELRGLPNTEGAEVFHQLFKETNIFWGK